MKKLTTILLTSVFLLARPDKVTTQSAEPPNLASSNSIVTETNMNLDSPTRYILRTRWADEIVGAYNTINRHDIITPEAVESLMMIESNGKLKVRSRSGAVGLMQLLPATYRKFSNKCRRGIYDAKCNIYAGINCMNFIVDECRKYSDWEKINEYQKLSIIVALYNTGTGNGNPNKGIMKRVWNYVIDDNGRISHQTKNHIKKFWDEMRNYMEPCRPELVLSQ